MPRFSHRSEPLLGSQDSYTNITWKMISHQTQRCKPTPNNKDTRVVVYAMVAEKGWQRLQMVQL